MAYNLKETLNKEERLSPGHRMCAGCGATIAVRNVLRGLHDGDEAVITCATSCLEVSSFMYPYTAWKDSFIHDAFENAGATCSGVEAAYRALSKKGKVKNTHKFIAFGGDGGTYDIGFQSLSGAMERNHDMVYVCYDNEAYMNTGIQRSSATPLYADTTTTPVGSDSEGKTQNRKDLAQVIAAHNIPYVAQTTFVKNFKDIHVKSEKAIYTPGAAFLNVLAPCPRGWRYDMADILNICQLAVDTVSGLYLKSLTESGSSTMNQRKNCRSKIFFVRRVVLNICSNREKNSSSPIFRLRWINVAMILKRAK